jgi:hypothetical protein
LITLKTTKSTKRIAIGKSTMGKLFIPCTTEKIIRPITTKPVLINKKVVMRKPIKVINNSIQLFIIYVLSQLQPITDTAQSTCKYMLIQNNNNNNSVN